VGGLASGDGAYALASFVSGFAAFGPATSEPPNLSIYAIKYHRVLRLQAKVFFFGKKEVHFDIILTTTLKKIGFLCLAVEGELNCQKNGSHLILGGRE